jgi:hypothetical protein
MIWRNPIFKRYSRSQLRLRKSIFWYLLTLIGTAFTVAIIYVPQIVRDRDPADAARGALLPILIIQGIIMLFMGTGSVASGVAKEKADDVLNYQRLTPLPTRDKVLGYLFGLPVREYVLFAITLPFLAFVLIVGRIAPVDFITYFLVFATSTLLYHLTGLVAGMVSRHWRWSARISQGLILMLYFALPQLSHLGIIFPEFLTVRPVFAETMLPYVSEMGEEVSFQNVGLLSGKDVPFFDLMISGTLFSFIIQSLLITLFVFVVARKWKAETIPPVSKAMAAITFSVVAFFSMANMWPNLTRSENALPIFQSGGDLAADVAVFALPMMLSIVCLFLGCALMLSACPDPMQYRMGQLRKRRLGLKLLPVTDDAATGAPLVLLFLSLLTVVQLTTLTTLSGTGYFAEAESNPVSGVWLFAASALFLYLFRLLKENFGGGQMGLFILLGWIVPILAAVLVIATNEANARFALIAAAISPLALVGMSATQLFSPDRLEEGTLYVQQALFVGFLVITLTASALQYRLFKLRKAILGSL